MLKGLAAVLLILLGSSIYGQDGSGGDGLGVFPETPGRNLHLEDRTYPRDFVGTWNLAFVAFQREHQEIINTWLPEAEELEEAYPGLAYYELPIIRELGGLAQGFIDRGMRVAVRSDKARERTITFYTDKERFKESLELQDEETIYVLLIDAEGRVLWRDRGGFTPAKRSELEQKLRELSE